MGYEMKAEEFDAAFALRQAQDERVFRQAQDERPAIDPVAELKAEVAALGARLTKAQRPALGGAAEGRKGEERKAFVEGYLRQGRMDGVAVKSLTTETGEQGGYAVPETIDAAIGAILKDVSPIRAIANVVTVGSANYRKLVTTGGIVSGWVGETEGRPETATPEFAEIAPPMGELYANPAASQTMLDDAMFNVEDWLAAEIAHEFARAEGQAFVMGSGNGQPRGFLGYATSAQIDANRPFGTLQHVKTGATGTFGGSAGDRLIDLVHALRPAYRQNAAWVMNSTTLAAIRKLKDGDGNFLWRPGLGDGQAQTLLGYKLVEAEDMPDIGADSLSIAFGDFQAGYVIAEAAATRILRDPFTNKPFVHFYATKRVGGAVTNSEAIKLMKFGA